MVYYAMSEHDRDDLPFPLRADAWMWSDGDLWVAVYADFHEDWREGGDPEVAAQRPVNWKRSIEDVPTSGTLTYRTADGEIVEEAA